MRWCRVNKMGEPILAHVRDVKERALLSGMKVGGEDAGFIAQGHGIASIVHHASTKL